LSTFRATLAALLAAWLAPALAQEPAAQPALPDLAVPSLAELEKRGARIGEIVIDPQNIFDLDDPRENNALFRLANRLHVRTRPEVIRRALLFAPGEPLSVQKVEETERLLRQNPYLYDVSIRPIQVHDDGVVDLEVVTRDTWSLKPDVSYGREGGVDTGSVSIEERNLLGTGVTLSLTRIREIDHSGTEFLLSDRHAFGGWTNIDYGYSDLDTGHRHSLAVTRPFYALDTRESAGVSVSDGDRIASDYRAGEIVSQYHHTRQFFDAFAGNSAGLVDGWVQRFSLGYNYESNDYELDPERDPPERLPEDVDLSGPYFRYELIEDDVRKLSNFDLIERPEFFALGLHSTLQVGRPLAAFGSTRDAWLYKIDLSDGVTLGPRDILLSTASFSARHDARATRRLLTGTMRYYAPQSPRALFFASVSGAVAKSPDISDVLQLGGDNGLRGYPLRYQTGDRRMLLTLEQRVYTDYFPFRLFRVGGAVFYDVGRAWGGPFGQGEANPGWLSYFGFGLRILSARSAFGNVIHADIAFPLSSGPNIKSTQFLVKSRTSF
jgi:outer membrane protein assembly factor BamA